MRPTRAAFLGLALTRPNALAHPVPDPDLLIRYAVNTTHAAQTASDVDAQSLNRLLGSGTNSMRNSNPEPKTQIYPQRSAQDAPYSLSEQELRSKIYFPETFSASSGKQPVILIPGTAVMAGTTYRANLAPLLAGSDFADPLWVNVPDASLGDAQVNAEYVAYAMNYVQSTTGRKAAVVAWSQGNLNAQWALKYWPSTREAVTDLVAMSPDFHGTKEAFVVCGTTMAAALVGCTPSVYQQGYDSQFVRTLRANGGESAYVPTTSIFSATDEIVQPQSGPIASAIMGEANGVAATNVEVQKACPGTVSGGEVTHEGMLYNSLAFALLRDAMTHEGPGKLERIDKRVCADPAAGKLDQAEISATEGVLVDAGKNVLMYKDKVRSEPPIMPYAR